MKVQHKAILLGFAGGVCYWLLDGLLDWLVWYEGPFLNTMVLGMAHREIYMRGLGLILFVSFGMIVGTIAARKQEAEQSRLDSETKFRNIVESSPLGMYMYRLETDGRLVLIDANAAADRIIGIDHSGLIGLTIEEAFPGLAETELPKIYRRAAAEGVSWHTDEFAYDHGQIKGIFEVHAVQTAPGRMVAIFSNVTERKRIQQEIAKLAKIPSENPNPVIRVTGEGMILYANEAARPVLDEWNCSQGQSLPEQQHQLIIDSLAKGQDTQAEFSCNDRIFVLTFAPVLEGSYVNIYGLDVTERRRAERELRAKEADHALILRSVPMVLYSTEAGGKFGTTWTSGHVEEITGIEAYRFIEDTDLWSSRLHPEDRDRVVQTFRQIPETGSATMEYRWQHEDGSWLWFLDQATLVRDEKGEPQEIIGLWLDITRRKKMEGALEASEQQFRTLSEASPAGIFIFQDLKFRYVNPVLAKIFGYDVEELVDKLGPLDLTQAEDRSASKDYIEQILSGQAIEPEFSFRGRRKNDSVIDCEVLCKAVNYQGRPSIIGTVLDVSERKQKEERILRQSAVLNGINEVFQETLTGENEADVGRTCLAVAEKLTGSKFGFIGELNEDGLFDTTAISNPGWDACRMPGSDATRLTKNMKIRGVDRSTLREGESRIVNEPASHPDHVETPEGHPRITCFLGVPLKRTGKTIGMIGLANKESGYEPTDQEAIESLSVAFVEALQRKRAEEALRRAKDELELRGEQRTADLAQTVQVLQKEVEDRRSAEKALRESQSRLINAQRIGRMGFWDWNIQTNELYWSDEVYRIFGLSQQEFGATHEFFMNSVHPQDRGFVQEQIDKAVKDGAQYSIDYRIIQPSGEVRCINEQGEVTLDSDGKSIRIVGTVIDISERKQAEEAVESERRRLYAVLQMLPGFVILRDENYRIRFANDKFFDLFGEPSDRPCHTLLHGRDEPCESCPALAVLRTGRSGRWEEIAPDGRVFEIWGYPFSDIDGTALVLELGMEITERRELETAVLKISEEERRRFGQDLHDSLGQILSGISCLSGSLHSKLAAKSAPETAEAEQIESLVIDSINLTRSLARGVSPVGSEPESLMDALQHLASSTENMFGIKCAFQCRRPLIISDNFVATHLYRIAQEAAHNAVRHGNAEKVIIKLSGPLPQVVLSIEDNGSGLPDDINRSKGTGLDTMKYRANAIGASLTVRRRGEGGTTVLCRLKQVKPVEKTK